MFEINARTVLSSFSSLLSFRIVFFSSLSILYPLCSHHYTVFWELFASSLFIFARFNFFLAFCSFFTDEGRQLLLSFFFSFFSFPGSAINWSFMVIIIIYTLLFLHLEGFSIYNTTHSFKLRPVRRVGKRSLVECFVLSLKTARCTSEKWR